MAENKQKGDNKKIPLSIKENPLVPGSPSLRHPELLKKPKRKEKY